MGRSSSSRNRRFIDDGDGYMRTDYADSSKKSDDSNIFYSAMTEGGGIYVVSNGHQTKDIFQALSNGFGHFIAIQDWNYENDHPNFTPIISSSCMLILGDEGTDCFVDISIIKKSRFGTAGSERQLFNYADFIPGLGYCITTYQCDGNPLSSFVGEPYLLPLVGSAEQAAQNIWNILNEANRVAIAIKSISLKNGESSIFIINKY